MPDDPGVPLTPSAEEDPPESDQKRIDEERIARIVRAATGAARQAEADERREILDEVEKLSARKSGPFRSLLLLAASVAVFALFGRIVWGWEILGLILIVVVVHEAGHFAGMKVFGYGDVSMFFIPLFGGAVSGRGTNVPGWKRALVALMGPVPGLALGVACWIAYSQTGVGFISRLAQGFLLINGFNLLPFYPLDGGHLLNEVLFCRSRYAELAVRLAGGALLALFGLLAGYWVLILLGAIAIFFSTGTFKVAGLAEKLRERLGPEVLTEAEAITPELAGPVIAEVRAEYPHLAEPVDIAHKVDEIWERLKTRPPGLLATLAILAFYLSLPVFVALAFALISLT